MSESIGVRMHVDWTYLIPPIKVKVRIGRIAPIRAFGYSSSPDFLVPFVVRNRCHFIFGKMSVRILS